MRGLREDRDLSQKELAVLLKVHQTTYSDYELGNINIPTAILMRLAEFYGTSIDYLLDFTDQRIPYPRRGR
ncbi:helix-turn-helix domain-containing protein [Agathobaculum sp.]|uniref:helix-turn-helix domain-containing protein n=1 Tax=Agathobaculum sp. TaxID=2048138 RepID=UPI002A823314|nr:helix-turn-helix transcriptional regulator [Agathobaculum sp.]MDY3619083.1 helix-turn-helix transcriptional regulator [Agathobaculum sp.]